MTIELISARGKKKELKRWVKMLRVKGYSSSFTSVVRQKLVGQCMWMNSIQCQSFNSSFLKDEMFTIIRFLSYVFKISLLGKIKRSFK